MDVDDRLARSPTGSTILLVPRLTAECRDLIVCQRGLIADWQAKPLGLSRAALQRATRIGWTQVSPHVFSDRSGDLAIDQLRAAGALECGPWAMLAGRSALAEAGWSVGQPESWVDVIVARGQRMRARQLPGWLRVHHPQDEAVGRGWPPRTRAPRAAIDAAAWARTPREVLFLITSSVQQRLVTPDELRAELNSRRRVRNAPHIRHALAALADGATTTSEATFLRECRRRGLPRPRMQVHRRGPSGHRVVDAEFRLPGGRLLMVEIDGVGHMEVDSWQADIVRHNDLVALTGALILRVTSWQIEHDPDPFFAVLCRFFESA